jgi:hypothetical protein
MNEGPVRKWCRMSEDGLTNVDAGERCVRPSVVSDDPVQSVDKKNCARRRFKVSELSCEFPQISCNLLYDIITVRLGYHRFCARQVPKILTGVHKTRRIVRLWLFDGTWVSFVNVETKEQYKLWIHTYSPNNKKSLNEGCLPGGKLMAIVFWDRKGVLMVESMQQGTTITSEVYYKTLKNNLRMAIRTRGVECWHPV